MASQDRNGPIGGGRLGRLSEFGRLQVAEGYPDIRGWPVKGADGTPLGRVHDLLVDRDVMRVRYLDVELDAPLRGHEQQLSDVIGSAARAARDIAENTEGHMLLPIGSVRLHDWYDDVVVDGLTAQSIESLPPIEHRAPLGLAGAGAAGAVGYGGAHDDRATRDVEPRRDTPSLHAQPHAQPHAMHDRELGMPRAAAVPSADHAERMTLAEERLEVGTQRMNAGHVDVRKTVDVERVTERHQVAREEVQIERRAVTGDASLEPTITADEIRIPILEERLVVEKRLVVREEIVIRKHHVVEERVVEADLRRERLLVDDAAAPGLVHGRGAAPLGDERLRASDPRLTDPRVDLDRPR